jgi:UDP-glucose 4-epimerase
MVRCENLRHEDPGATLHTPHIATRRHQDFVDTNITGTLTLLEEALAA